MSIIDPRRALERLTVDSFGGIRSHAGLEAGAAADLRNFRILPDGSLEKRCGFATRFSFSVPVRGTWEGTIGGVSYFFAVAGDTVYCLEPDAEAPEAIYYLTTETGAVSFVYFVDRLYLLDGASMLFFRTGTGTFHISTGYTPLYGQNWHPTEMGSVNEPLNLVQNRIRIHYLNTTGSTVFQMPYTMKSVDRVKLNGSYITNYTFTPGSSTFRIPEGSAPGTVEVAATLDDIFNRRSTVLRCGNATVYKDPYHETMLLWGGTPGYTVYRTAHLTGQQLADCTSFYGSTDPVYIPENTSFAVGSAQHPVTAICQNGEQALVFNDRSLWGIRHTDEESDGMQIVLIDGGIGCCPSRGAIPCGNDTVTVRENGISLLHFSSGNPDVCTARTISGEIADRMTRSLLQNAILLWSRSANELWVHNPKDSAGLFWIYNLDRAFWTCFAITPAVGLLESGGSVGLCSASGPILYADEALDTDNGVPIAAYYQSHFLSLSEPSLYKRAIRASLCADTGNATLTLGLQTERDEQDFTLTGSDTEAPEFLDRRLSLGRFRFLRYRISAFGSARVRIYFLSLSAT